MKKTRKIITFEAEPDVDSMLKRARESGLTVGSIVNDAVREHGGKVITRLAKEQLDKLRKLAAMTFNCPDLQSGGLDQAA